MKRGCIILAMATAAVAHTALGGTNMIADIAPSAGGKLFEHNCAHCHGDDARGDEGPDLRGLKKSDERIGRIIRNGIKGEMPAFGKKFNDADVQSLVDYLRTLKK